MINFNDLYCCSYPYPTKLFNIRLGSKTYNFVTTTLSSRIALYCSQPDQKKYRK